MTMPQLMEEQGLPLVDNSKTGFIQSFFPQLPGASTDESNVQSGRDFKITQPNLLLLYLFT